MSRLFISFSLSFLTDGRWVVEVCLEWAHVLCIGFFHDVVGVVLVCTCVCVWVGVIYFSIRTTRTLLPQFRVGYKKFFFNSQKKNDECHI